MNVLFEECIEALSPTVVIENEDKKSEVLKLIMRKIKFNGFNINWNDYSSKIDFKSFKEVEEIKLPNTSCFVIWDSFDVPMISTYSKQVILNWDDVVCVGFDTLIIDTNFCWILENHHEGMIKYMNIS